MAARDVITFGFSGQGAGTIPMLGFSAGDTVAPPAPTGKSFSAPYDAMADLFFRRERIIVLNDDEIVLLGLELLND